MGSTRWDANSSAKSPRRRELVPLGEIGAVESGDNWAIGGNSTANTNFFDGRLDDVRVYKGVLSEAAIAVLAGTSPALDRVSGRLTKIEDTNGHSTNLT
ncbi:MAG: LamG domain-containing protein, partial [Planctomycetes bacterium]|nr:LamG domain-containing protein [Planctomycetota bacterium]